MVQSSNAADTNGEIDRIIQEIEDMEKSIDAVPAASQAAVTNNVVPMKKAEERVEHAEEAPEAESLVESDAVPVANEPLAFERDAPGAEGTRGLALRVGNCSEVSLEFSQGGVAVTLRCNDECLTITTDSGAEFRVPFRKRAA